MSKVEYKYRDGFKSRPKISAEVCYKAIERVRKANDGRVTASALVDAAKRKTHKLHDYFEWRDKVAGQQWRRQQARQLIGGIQVVVDDHKPVRGYQNVTVSFEPNADGGNIEAVRAYTSTEEALADPVLRQQVLKRAMGEAVSWRKRYDALHELSDVFAVIDSINEESEVTSS